MAQDVLAAAQASGMFFFLDSDLKIDEPQSVLKIDADKTAALGLKLSDVGGAMASMLGGGYVNYFSLDGRLLQGDPAGAAILPPQSGSVAGLLHPHAKRCLRAALDRSDHSDEDRA